MSNPTTRPTEIIPSTPVHSQRIPAQNQSRQLVSRALDDAGRQRVLVRQARRATDEVPEGGLILVFVDTRGPDDRVAAYVPGADLVLFPRYSLILDRTRRAPAALAHEALAMAETLLKTKFELCHRPQQREI